MGDNLGKIVSEEKRKAEGGVAKGGTGECRIFLPDGNPGGWVGGGIPDCMHPGPCQIHHGPPRKSQTQLFAAVEENMRLTSL